MILAVYLKKLRNYVSHIINFRSLFCPIQVYGGDGGFLITTKCHVFAKLRNWFLKSKNIQQAFLNHASSLCEKDTQG